MNRFGSLLQLYRAEEGMTQQQLADFSAMSVRAIRDLERGRAERPRRDTVRMLADALRLKADRREAFERAARPCPDIDRSELMDLQLVPRESEYEYATMLLESLSTDSGDGDWADALNDMAKQNWRLVTVDRGVAFLERRLDQA
ncbi:helix-turn-helix domain-containing protein [Streptomyces sp. NRRL S-350]|uniref:helix-turn-helix domain-containing protein n=1 Tax=Streptomyces sp. NRRL S-350 TaxID=1463902 RepID=UPI001F181546|nr:helix-turn-helix transcriptional regulator [Streptomyces sp. NRRL S-350]